MSLGRMKLEGSLADLILTLLALVSTTGTGLDTLPAYYLALK
jgi:hypothetical protein